MARSGVVGFAPKEDPMVQTMLKLREDIFPDYSLERFLDCLGTHATVKRIESRSMGAGLSGLAQTAPELDRTR